MMLLALFSLTYAQDPEVPVEPVEQVCPEGYVCLTKEQYAQVFSKLQELEVIEEGQPTIVFSEPLVIMTDEKGRVLTNATGEDTSKLIPGTLEWRHLGADLALKVDVEVHRTLPPNGGFRLRPKLLTSYLILRTDLIDPMKAVDFGFDLDFLYWRKWNLSAYLGARSIGVDIGFDVFANSGVGVGAHWVWPSGTEIFPFSPAAGWYFAF